MTRVTLQLVSRQAIALGSDSKGKTRETRVTVVVAYIYPQTARPEPIAGTTDLKVIIGMGEVGVGAPGSEG